MALSRQDPAPVYSQKAAMWARVRVEVEQARCRRGLRSLAQREELWVFCAMTTH